MHRNELVLMFKKLINETLPATFQSPVRFNHCFNRIILDWLFQDCWYHYLNKKKTAISQLSVDQLMKAVQRMNDWLHTPTLLIQDNLDSLRYRREIKQKSL